MLDFRLNVFICVAHNLSFSKAANELYITQPAVTKHIKELESEFEAKLFNRHGNKIELTKAGILLLSYGEKIQSLHNEVKFEMSRLKGKSKGELRIGASTTISQYVIPSALSKFHERYPDINLSLVNGNTLQIEKRLLKNDIDFGIVEGKPGNTDIRYSPFLNDELIVFTSSQNKSVPQVVSAKELASLPLVLRERGSGTLEIIENSLQQYGVNLKSLQVLMYLGSTEAIKSFVKTGSGVGIVSRFAIEHELLSGIFRQINTSNIWFQRQFYFISPQGPEPSGLTKLFVNFLQNYYNLKL